jgi:hypothetical protein
MPKKHKNKKEDVLEVGLKASEEVDPKILGKELDHTKDPITTEPPVQDPKRRKIKCNIL